MNESFNVNKCSDQTGIANFEYLVHMFPGSRRSQGTSMHKPTLCRRVVHAMKQRFDHPQRMTYRKASNSRRVSNKRRSPINAGDMAVLKKINADL